jgi:hypothetical protein
MTGYGQKWLTIALNGNFGISGEECWTAATNGYLKEFIQTSVYNSFNSVPSVTQFTSYTTYYQFFKAYTDGLPH